MTYPEVQFVAAPEDGAEVLFDFNDNMPGEAPAQIVAGTFTLGTPSVIGDPDGLGVQYGSRTVGFTLLIFGNRQAAMQTQSLLARTFMLRRRGWLRVKMDDYSSPVWLRTYTPTPGELDFSLIQPDSEEDAWQIEVEVSAEPFIRGQRIELGTWTINNDPAATTNPMSVTLPAAVGDAPAPLRLEAAFSGYMGQHDVAWSCAAVPDGYSPVVWQIGSGDGWELGGNMSTPTFDANMSGGSYRSVISFGTAGGLATRMAGNSTGPTPPGGRYRVFLRAARPASDGVFAFRLGYRTGNGDLFGASPRVVLDRNEWTWLDLGSFDFPLPHADVDYPVAQIQPSIALAVERVSGSATVYLDALMLIPESVASVTELESWEKSDLLVSEFSAVGPPGGHSQMWDGDSEVTLRMIPGGGLDAQVGAVNRGRFPSVRPGVTNHLTLMQQTRAASSSSYPNPDSLSQTAVVSASYQPRWLWLGDA